MEPLSFGLGLIEGFYGRSWADADRLDLISFLARRDYKYYVYAPKGDAVLRRDWSGRWSRAREAAIRSMAMHCQREQVLWGVGLSPLGLVEDGGRAARSRLRDKVRYLDDMGVQILCILFDDMPRNLDDLAAAQADVMNEVLAVTKARHVLLCPSYYSTDPILEKLFGVMPSGYWESLGERISPDVGIFWTGNKVCAEEHEPSELQRIADRLGRKPALWDNYPVNDGARGSKFIRIDAFRGRQSSLADLTQAHFVNPMNQCWLSRIPLATLPLVYSCGSHYDAGEAFIRCVRELCGKALGDLLTADLELLQRQGLDGIAEHQLQLLLERYASQHSPCAREIVDWLRGGYAFDPACLTD
jgi:hyaluronoglucosaminidase